MTALNLLALFGTMLLISAVPGPSDIAVIARALANFRQALWMIVGIIVADAGLIVLAVYSTSAMSTMSTTFAPILLWLKWLGAAFLCWLGIQLLRTKPEKLAITGVNTTAFNSFSSGFLITLGDPKALLFYLSLLPVFINLQTATITDALMILGAATVAIAGVKITYAYLAQHALRLLNQTEYRQRLNRIAGLVLMGTGIWLALGAALR